MKILLNGLCNNRSGKLFGNFFHMLRLSEALGKRSDIELRVLADEFGAEHYGELIGSHRVLVEKCGTRGAMARDARVIAACRDWNPDVFHRPTGQLPLRSLPCAAVMTVADLNWRELGAPLAQRLYKDLTYALSVRRAERITCISEYTQASLLRCFPRAAGKTSVIYHGSTALRGEEPEMVEGLGPYFLTFGHHPHKNVETCLRALRRLGPAAPLLVVVGMNDYVRDTVKPMVAEMGLTERVRFVGRVSEAGLLTLYRNAIALLFMSRFEGFGLPVLEAMGASCPVIGSNVTSLPEVIGEGGIQVNVEDDEALATEMKTLTDNPALRDEWVARGHRWADRFTWRKAAEETVDVYREALKQHRARHKQF